MMEIYLIFHISYLLLFSRRIGFVFLHTKLSFYHTHTPQTFTLLSLPLYLSLSLFRVSTTAQQPLKISTTNKSIKKKAQQQQAETT